MPFFKRSLRFLPAVGLLPLAGCVEVPPLDGPAKIPINSVVNRLKCDLWHVYRNKITQDQKFIFLKEWSVKAHLTLIVDNTATLNPGATLVKPLRNAYAVAAGPTSLGGTTIGAVSQSFSLGIGAGLTTEAVATTDIEFFLSFGEMEKEAARYDACSKGNGLLLDSDLQLDALFDTALEPVQADILRNGNHPGFGSSTPPQINNKALIDAGSAIRKTGDVLLTKPTKFRSLSSINQFAEIVKAVPDTAHMFIEGVPPGNQLDAFLNSNPVAKQKAEKEYDDARELETNKQNATAVEVQAKVIVEDIVKPISDIIAASYPACAARSLQLKEKSIIQLALIASEAAQIQFQTQINLSNTSFRNIQSKRKQLVESSTKAVEELYSCPNEPTPSKKEAIYDPIDLISQTINFYITASGSVTPTWKLINVNAPLAPTFALASRKYTDTLIIVFGRPDPGKATSTAIENQILTGTLRDAIGPR